MMHSQAVPFLLNVVPYDVAASDLDAELAQLEAEEDSRGNVEE